jgi:hypothetical protein
MLCWNLLTALILDMTGLMALGRAEHFSVETEDTQPSGDDPSGDPESREASGAGFSDYQVTDLELLETLIDEDYEAGRIMGLWGRQDSVANNGTTQQPTSTSKGPVPRSKLFRQFFFLRRMEPEQGMPLAVAPVNRGDRQQARGGRQPGRGSGQKSYWSKIKDEDDVQIIRR